MRQDDGIMFVRIFRFGDGRENGGKIASNDKLQHDIAMVIATIVTEGMESSRT